MLKTPGIQCNTQITLASCLFSQNKVDFMIISSKCTKMSPTAKSSYSLFDSSSSLPSPSTFFFPISVGA